MKKLSAKRVEGRGLATQNGYPTINIQLDLGEVEEGVWLCLLTIGLGWQQSRYESIASVSEYNGCLGVEIHSFEQNKYPKIKVDVGDEISILFIKKIRGKIKIKDPIDQIEKDIELAKANLKTCETCCRFYSQDTGYSNYTVEGIYYGCYANVFNQSEDSWDTPEYYSNSEVKYNALNCGVRSEGTMWSLDVDGEVPRPTEDWLKAIDRDVKLGKLLD